MRLRRCGEGPGSGGLPDARLSTWPNVGAAILRWPDSLDRAKPFAAVVGALTRARREPQKRGLKRRSPAILTTELADAEPDGSRPKLWNLHALLQGYGSYRSAETARRLV